MKKATGTTKLGFVLLFLAFILPLIGGGAWILIEYSKVRSMAFSTYINNIASAISYLVTSSGASSFDLVILACIYCAPLLLGIAFLSEANDHVFGRIFGGVIMLAISVYFYIQVIGTAETFLSNPGSIIEQAARNAYGSSYVSVPSSMYAGVINSYATSARLMIYGGAVLTALMMVSILTGIRVTSVISGLGFLVFIGVFIYGLAKVSPYMGSVPTVAQIFAIGYISLVLLGKMFCCFGCGKKPEISAYASPYGNAYNP